MANHKSALKRIRSNEAKRVLNKYQHKTTRNAIKKLRETTNKKEAQKLFITVSSMIDKLAKNTSFMITRLQILSQVYQNLLWRCKFIILYKKKPFIIERLFFMNSIK